MVMAKVILIIGAPGRTDAGQVCIGSRKKHYMSIDLVLWNPDYIISIYP